MIKLAGGNKTGGKMTLFVECRGSGMSIVPLQQTASSRLASGFDPRFVTGSQFKLVFYNAFVFSNVCVTY